MTLVLDALSWVFLVSGSLLSIISGIGMLRFPDFYTRMHAAGISDTMAAGLIITGLCIQAGLSLVTVKLLFVLFFLFVTSPTAAHALAKAALTAGQRPAGRSERGTPSNP